ncbi:MAG: hypothetical protein P8Y67_01170 [Alphaproteobacteria bacterium]
MKKIMLLAIIGTLLFCKYAKAGDWEDIWAPYLMRQDKATASSGDAQAINRNAHIITPWPYYVRNRRIPANAARMMKHYKVYTGEEAKKKSSSKKGNALIDTMEKMFSGKDK